MADGSFRHPKRRRKLGRARRALVEESDDAAAGRVRDGTKPLGLLDGEDVVEVVVGRTVDDRGTYGKSRPFARDVEVRLQLDPGVRCSEPE
jgi:hypothetical protein